jgi:putative transposase
MGPMRSAHPGVYVCQVHLVFCPHYRRKVLVPPLDERLTTSLAERRARWGRERSELEGVPDPVHLLVGCAPQCGIPRPVKRRKGHGSHALRAEFPVLKRRLPSRWTNSSSCATTGGVPLETLDGCAQDQQGT